MEGAQDIFYVSASVAMILLSVFLIILFVQIILVYRKIRGLTDAVQHEVRRVYRTKLAMKVRLLEFVGGILGVQTKGGEEL
jgi:hypothetical protein